MTSLLVNPENKDDFYDALRFEYMLLGKILSDNDLMDNILFLKVDHFQGKYHAEIFERMKDLRALEEPIKLETLAPFIEMPGGVMKYLMRSSVSSWVSEDGIELARQVVEYAKRRQLQVFLRDKALELEGNGKMSHEIITDVQLELQKIGSESGMIRFSTKKEVGDRILKRLDNRDKPFSTGIRALDRAMDGGMYPGMCYLLAGRKKMGKTTLAGTISCNLNMENRRHLYIACEMSEEEIEQRNLARVTQSYASSFRNDYGRSEEFKNKISAAILSENDATIYLDWASIPFENLKSAIAQAIPRYGIKGFVLDCLQLVGGKSPKKSQAEHQDDVAQWCVTYARQKGLFSVITAQINQTGNIRGGEGVRMACDMAFEVHAPEDDPSRSERWLEMIETRYTGWADVGSKDNCVLVMNENGPYMYERIHDEQAPLPL